MRRIGVALAAAFLSGCAQLSASRTVCPEYRGIRCMTAAECSMDRARGCQVCQCSPSEGPERGVLPSGIAPDRRTP